MFELLNRILDAIWSLCFLDEDIYKDNREVMDLSEGTQEAGFLPVMISSDTGQACMDPGGFLQVLWLYPIIVLITSLRPEWRWSVQVDFPGTRMLPLQTIDLELINWSWRQPDLAWEGLGSLKCLWLEGSDFNEELKCMWCFQELVPLCQRSGHSKLDQWL